MDIFSVAALGLIGAILAITIKQTRPELALLVSLATGLSIIIYTLKSFGSIFTLFEEVINKSGVNPAYFTLALKACAIAYVTEFASALCKDAGENAIAVKTELAGKISILFISMPIVFGLLTSISELLDKI